MNRLLHLFVEDVRLAVSIALCVLACAGLAAAAPASVLLLPLGLAAALLASLRRGSRPWPPA